MKKNHAILKAMSVLWSFKEFKTLRLSMHMIFILMIAVNSTLGGISPSETRETFQQITVTGMVTDAQTGDPLPGVNIVIQGTTQGTTTDVDGSYSIGAPPDATLVFSFVGYQSSTINVQNRTEINVTLEQAVTELEEVVAVGYGTQRKENLTGSVSQINSEEIEMRSVNSATQALSGLSPN